MIIGKNVKPTIPPVPGGTYLAVCVYELGIGEQLCKFKDTTKYNRQWMVGFELVGQTVEVDGKQEPRQLSRTFNCAKGQNAGLRKFLEAWLGKKFTDDEYLRFDTRQLLGKPAMLNVVLNDTGEYANIDGIMQLPAAIPAPTATLPCYHFDIDDGFDMEAFNGLPDWMQARIKKSTEYQKEFAPVQEVRVEVPQGTGTVQANTAVPGVPEGVCPI